MWFQTGRFAVGDNGEPSISTSCGVYSEHLKLINCVNNMRFMSSQYKAVNNRANVIHWHCCLSSPVRMSCTAVVTASSGAVDSPPNPRLQLSHWLLQVTEQIVCSTNIEKRQVHDT